jgi:hypothetical protein
MLCWQPGNVQPFLKELTPGLFHLFGRDGVFPGMIQFCLLSDLFLSDIEMPQPFQIRKDLNDITIIPSLLSLFLLFCGGFHVSQWQ